MSAVVTLSLTVTLDEGTDPNDPSNSLEARENIIRNSLKDCLIGNVGMIFDTGVSYTGVLNGPDQGESEFSYPEPEE